MNCSLYCDARLQGASYSFIYFIFNINIGGYIIGSGSGLINLIHANILNKPDLATTANLNSISTNSALSINGHTTQISNLNNIVFIRAGSGEGLTTL